MSSTPTGSRPARVHPGRAPVAGTALVVGCLVLLGCSSADKPVLGEPVAATEAGDSGQDDQVSDGDVPGEFVTSDGIALAFDDEGSGSRAVVLAHQRGSDRSSWADFAQTLTNAGYRVIVPDFRGYGESPGERDTNLDLDLTAAVDYALATGSTDVVLIGASMGGTAAVVVASQADVAGVISLSGPSSFAGLDASVAASTLTIPTLFLVAENDLPYVEDISEQATAAGDEPQVFGGAAHGTALLDEHGEPITEQILGLLANA